MHLLLTSSPCTVSAPEGVNLPFVYNSANGFVDCLRRGLSEPFSAVMVAADPDAASRNDEMAWAFGEALRWHGLPLTGMTMVDRRNAAACADLVAGSGLVMLSGGHVPTELAFFEELGLRNILRGYPGTVMGISAGSMNAAEVVYIQPEEAGESLDPAFRRFAPGLALTPLNILPHYNQVRDNWLDGRRLIEDITLPDSFGHTFYVLCDGSYISTEEGTSTLYGEAWRMTDGHMQKCCENGESLCL